MAAEDENVYVPQQFENADNVAAHYEGTGAEILRDAEGSIDGFCSGIGTGGTITGVGRALRDANPDVQVWAVEPENAAILSGGTVGTHLQMGIGDGIIPAILDRKVIDRVVTVSDPEAISMARRLAREEGIMRIYVETDGTQDFRDIADAVAEETKSRIGLTPLVKVVELGVLPRSEKKTKRVFDERYE